MPNSFPKDFLWGVSTASAQIEGAYNEDGKGLSIWDVAKPSKIKNNENTHIACDHYHKYKEDVALMKTLGVKSYRFSISWPRVISDDNVINQKGLEFYSNLVDELIKNNIEPIITLYHWDLPVWMENKGGWKNKLIVEKFSFYTKVVIDALSDRVKYWLTFNEPQCFILNGYLTKIHAPFKSNVFIISKLIRHFMLANYEAVKIIRENSKLKPLIGLSFGSGAFIPEDENNLESVNKAYINSFSKTMSGTINNALFLDPVLLGKGASKFLIYHISDKFAKKVKVNFDFLAINNYEAFNYSSYTFNKVDKTRYNQTQMGWVIDGRTLYYTSKFMYQRYNLPIMITENGMANDDKVVDNKIDDVKRIDFIKEYLSNVKKAIDDGVNIIGFHYWSFMDNFEWAEGYTPRFGLVHIDYQTLIRTPKESFYYYKSIIETNGKNL